MSEATETSTVPTFELVEKKQSFFARRIVTPIKNHPKIAIAIVGGLALVGAAAFVAQNDESDSTSDNENAEDNVADTTVA